jgi:hypothetical protein
MRPNQKVSLGCGTLILIALIVTMCSGSGNTHNMSKELQEVKSEIQELKLTIEAQRADIRHLQDLIETQKQEKEPPKQ